MKKGFTLLELLLVISILAVLAGLIIYNLRPASVLQATHEQTALAHIKQLRDAIALYILEGGVMPSDIHQWEGVADFYGENCNGNYSHICNGDVETEPGVACNNLEPDDSTDLSFLVDEGYLSSLPRYPTIGEGWGDSTGYMITTNNEGVYKLCVHQDIDLNGPIIRYVN